MLKPLFNKGSGLKACFFILKETLTQKFLCEQKLLCFFFIEGLFVMPFRNVISWQIIDILELYFTTVNFAFTKICRQLKLQREVSSLKLNSFGFKFQQVHLFQKLSPGVAVLKRCGLQLYQKETLTQVFSCEYSEIFKNTFLQNTSSGCFFYSEITRFY